LICIKFHDRAKTHNRHYVDFVALPQGVGFCPLFPHRSGFTAVNRAHELTELCGVAELWSVPALTPRVYAYAFPIAWSGSRNGNMANGQRNPH